MPDETIEPVGEAVRVHPVIPGGHTAGSGRAHDGRIVGEIVAVHRRTSGHPEPGHLLDTSVGAEMHSEVVIRTEADDVEGLVGKRVALHFLT